MHTHLWWCGDDEAVTGHFDWCIKYYYCCYCYYLLNKYTKRLQKFDLLREEEEKV